MDKPEPLSGDASVSLPRGSHARMREKETESAADAIRSRLRYDPGSGGLHWTCSYMSVREGAKAGSLERNGYLKVVVGGLSYKAHRVAWLLANGQWPKGQIDHINGNRSDNRLVNLRDVDQCANQHNQHRRDTGKLVGAFFHKDSGKFQASIRHRGREHYLGLYETEREARAAYLAAKRIFHGHLAEAQNECAAIDAA